MAINYDVPEDKRALYWLGDKLIEWRNPVMIPGIDLAGQVIASTHPRWTIGDDVVLGGWGVGAPARPELHAPMTTAAISTATLTHPGRSSGARRRRIKRWSHVGRVGRAIRKSSRRPPGSSA